MNIGPQSNFWSSDAFVATGCGNQAAVACACGWSPSPLGEQPNIFLWVDCIPPVPSHSHFLLQETNTFLGFWSYPWYVHFHPNHITNMPYTVSRVNGTIHRVPRSTRYCPGNLWMESDLFLDTLYHFPFGQVGLYSLRIHDAFHILCFFMRLGLVPHSLCSVSTNSPSTVLAFPSHSQHQFRPIPWRYMHLIYASLLAHQLT